MPLVNTLKPTTTLANTARPASFETWASIMTTWATETRTWIGCVSLIVNSTKRSTSITNVAKPS